MIRLTVQYRMAPSIVEWVDEFFYDNKLVNHASLEVDDEYRRIRRKISHDSYRIKGPRGDGSEYWNIMLSSEYRIINGIIYIYLQYRTAPAVVKRVNEFFYEEKLVNNDSVRAKY